MSLLLTAPATARAGLQYDLTVFIQSGHGLSRPAAALADTHFCPLPLHVGHV